jgi:hypothetical protein
MPEVPLFSELLRGDAEILDGFFPFLGVSAGKSAKLLWR